MAVDCFSPFTNHFRIAHDISLDNLSCISDENNEPDVSLQRSVSLDGSSSSTTTTTAPPINYLEHSFSVNMKNATNLLKGTGIMQFEDISSPLGLRSVLSSSSMTGSLRIEDVEKLEQGINQLDTEEARTKKSNDDLETERPVVDRTGMTGSTTDVDLSPRPSTSTSTETFQQRAPKRSEDDDVFMNEADRRKSTSSEEGLRTSPSPSSCPQSAAIRPGSTKRRRRPRKLPEIPTNAQRKNRTTVPLSALPNFQSLADEIQLADPKSSFNINQSASTTAWRYGISNKDPNGVDWRELGSPESIEPPFQLETDREHFMHAVFSPKEHRRGRSPDYDTHQSLRSELLKCQESKAKSPPHKTQYSPGTQRKSPEFLDQAQSPGRNVDYNTQFAYPTSPPSGGNLQSPDWKSSGCKVQSPDYMVESTESEAQSPSCRMSESYREVRSPGFKVESPGYSLPSPGYRVESPGFRVESSGRRVRSPGHKVESPGHKVESPGYKVESPGYKVESPFCKVESPRSKMESPRSKVESPRSKMESQAYRVQSPGYRGQSPAYKMQSPGYSQQSPAGCCRAESPDYGIKVSTNILCHNYPSFTYTDPLYARGGEFCESVEYFDDDPSHGRSLLRRLDDHIDLNLNTTPTTQVACTSADNRYQSDSSPDGASGGHRPSGYPGQDGGASGHSGGAREPSTSSSTPSEDFSDLEPSHRGCHKFIPRHMDEMFIEIGDPIYVEEESDDLWCEGINLKSGKHGIFPAAYATDLSLLEEEGPYKYSLRFLGSVEVNYYKGNDVLCQAIHKVAMSRKTNPQPAPLYCVEVNEYGIKMTDRSKKKKDRNKVEPPKDSTAAAIRQRLAKILKKDKETAANSDHFFSLKNVSFCGFHPKDDKYFAFITKHPVELRFACHVFHGDKSTRIITEVVGESFRKFYTEYMAFVHPTEDIYLE